MNAGWSHPGSDAAVWTESEWRDFEAATRRRALDAGDQAWSAIVPAARRVMRTYTTSFFIVSRFLPRAKRDDVEAIYATVRYPDEVVDTFPLTREERRARLDAWATAFERGLATSSVREALAREVPCFLAAFLEVSRRTGIPPEFYRAFLEAMRRDIDPAPFDSINDLVDRYIYGSAIVVGYFLTHVYGASEPGAFPRAMESARRLGIALQLTNFLRDVREDRRRGRCYLPRDLLAAEGLTPDSDPADPAFAEPFRRVIEALAAVAADHYRAARDALDAFAPDSRLAIRACIDVYGALNDRIRASRRGLDHRESVPFRAKWALLPPSKYWKIPLAYLPEFR